MACSPYIYTLSSCTRSSSRIDCLELSLQLEARVKGPQESIHEACLPIYSFHSRLDDAGRASCLPFTAPVPFQSQIAAVQGDSLPVIWFLSPSTRSYKLIAVSDLPATQCRWWLDVLLALYLNPIELYPGKLKRIQAAIQISRLESKKIQAAE